jgi:hypothetical protein
MRVLILNIDSKIPNLALKKIEKYHIDKGDEVVWDFELYNSDKIYVSCIFDWNKSKCREFEGRAEIGGTGYDLKIKLPDYIEKLKPKLNMGFTTRGCIRKCEYCVVPDKEGKIYIVGDLYDLWDGKSKEVTLFDNNILALPKQFFKICEQSQKENIRLDFNQGLDIRLLNDSVAKTLKETKLKEYRFAFDDIKLMKIVSRKIEILDKYKIRGLWYVLGGFKTTWQDSVDRINYLVKNKQRAYYMKHKFVDKDQRFSAVDTWCNHPMLGHGTIPFKDFLNNTPRGRTYLKHFSKEEI